MKKIRLKTVHYINWKGITLTNEKPSIDATEENLEKLKLFIASKQLEVIDLETDKKLDEEHPPIKEKPISLVDQSLETKKDIITNITRSRVYTVEELKAMTKAELISLCNERGLEFKKNMSVAKIEELILANQ